MALTDNPMSLVVTGNVTVGATLEANVPTTETYLVNINEDYTTVNETRTVHIPSGVKVTSPLGILASKLAPMVA